MTDGTRVAALAFGPGLTVESAMLTRRARVPRTSATDEDAAVAVPA